MKPSDHLLRHSLLLMAASQVGNLANILFHAVMGRWLTPSPAEYGVLSSMLGVVLIAGTPLGALNNMLAFYTARFKQQQRAADVVPLLRYWAIWLVLFSAALLAAGALFGGPLAEFFRLPGRAALLMAFFVLALSLFNPLLSGPLQGLQAFGWLAVSGLSWGVVRLAAGAALVLWVGPTAVWGLAGQGIGVAVSAGVAVAGLWAALRGQRPSGNALPGSQAYLWLSLLVLGLFSFLMNADILIVKHYFTPEASGLFARAATIGRTIVFLPMPIAGALFPKTVSDGVAGGGHGRLLGKALAMTLLLVAAGVAVCWLWPQLALGILYHDWAPDEPMKRLVRAMLLALSPLSLAYILMHFEMSQKRFVLVGPLLLCMAGYLLGVMVWHDTVIQVAAVLGAVSTTALGLLALCVLRGRPTGPGRLNGRRAGA